jgi:phosphoglycolate phosphatase
LLRAGWQEIMEAYFLEVLAAAAPGTPAAEHGRTCREFIERLTGRQTIYQALELEDRVRATSATPLPAAQYKAEYLRRLQQHIEHRLRDVRAGIQIPEDHLVSGSINLLARLKAAGVTCWLASGTDHARVVEEAELLGLTGFFAGAQDEPDRIYGALEDYQNFSKAMIIEKIMADFGLSGPELVAFGDGYVEIEETRRAGGIAVGIASRESGGVGFDPWKKQRLQQVGAHVLVADWSEVIQLFSLLHLTP